MHSCSPHQSSSFWSGRTVSSGALLLHPASRMRSPSHVPEAVLSAGVPIAAIAVLASFGALGSPAFQRTVELILSNIVIVIGLQTFIGLSGIYSFGHMGLAAIGAYLSAVVSLPIAFKTAQLPG